MRRAAKVDDNQPEIVKHLRGIGASVAHTHVLGQGFPDIIVGYRGVNYMIEIKDGSKPPSKRQLTNDEKEFHADWNGKIHVVEDVADSYYAIGAIDKKSHKMWKEGGGNPPPF